MKRCPECRRDYADETLNFCLDDGTALLDGPVTADQPTAIISGAGDSYDPLTRRFTEVIAEPVGRRTSDDLSLAPRSVSRGATIFAVAGIVALLAAAGYLIYRYRAPDKGVPRSIKLEKVTSEGKTFTAAI